MGRKEEIIKVTLELALKKGLDNVSMSQIASKLRIKKPSLYNHFHSKDEIIEEMYNYLRNQAKAQIEIRDIDYGKFVKDKNLEEILSGTVKKLLSNEYAKGYAFVL